MNSPFFTFRPPPFASNCRSASRPLRHAPPSIGEHGPALLRELGYGEDEIGRLRAEGVIGGLGDGIPDSA